MASLSADRPSEVVLAARVARQFYLEGVSKVDIADRLGISRFRVARLLDSARESGLVRIEIGLPGGALDAGPVGRAVLGLRPAARVRLQLPRRRVVAAPAARRGGGPGADGPDHAGRRARPDLVAHAERAHRRAHPAAAVPDRAAHRGGAAAGRPGPARTGARRGPRSAAAPRTCSTRRCWSTTRATAAAIRRQGDIAEAFALIPSVTIAVVSIGAWEPGLSTIYDAITPAERDGARGARRPRGDCRGVHRRGRQPARRRRLTAG